MGSKGRRQARKPRSLSRSLHPNPSESIRIGPGGSSNRESSRPLSRMLVSSMSPLESSNNNISVPRRVYSLRRENIEYCHHGCAKEWR